MCLFNAMWRIDICTNSCTYITVIFCHVIVNDRNTDMWLTATDLSKLAPSK